MIVSGNTLYGTAGETILVVSVFAVNTDGTGFTNLYTGGLGICTQCGDSLSGLILSERHPLWDGGARLGGYGGGWFLLFRGVRRQHRRHGFYEPLQFYGGSDGSISRIDFIGQHPLWDGRLAAVRRGTVFAVNTDGTGFTNLYSFTATDCTVPTATEPIRLAGLILSGNTLYGTAISGGSSGNGTVFAVNTDGTGFTTLHSFTDTERLYQQRRS